MQFSIIVLTAFAAIASAANCRTGLYYCHDSLMNRGNYGAQIAEATVKLVNANPGCAEARQIMEQPRTALYYCAGGANGEISIIKKCRTSCKDGGPERDDWCSEGTEVIDTQMKFPAFPPEKLAKRAGVEVPFKG